MKIDELMSKPVWQMTGEELMFLQSHNYEPKQRLTRMQTDALAALNNCRSDIVNYTSALRGMTVDRRRQLFNDHPYMLGWLNEQRRLARRIAAVIDELRQPNPIPQGTTNNISNDSNL